MKFNDKQQYRTGLWIVEDESFFTQSFKGRGWHIEFVSDTSDYPKMQNGNEIIIIAKKWETAQKAVNMIFNSLMLLDGSTQMTDLCPSVPVAIPLDEKVELPVDESFVNREFYFHSSFLSTACLIACKVSRKIKYQYALSRFALSSELFSLPVMNFEPYTNNHYKVSRFYEDHILFASAISIAYAGIEDLKLQIKASKAKPSKHDDGSWNEEVKADIERRLHQEGIDRDEPFYWMIRQPYTKISKNRINRLNPNPEIRNLYGEKGIALIDAISEAGFLRSKVSAHASGHLTKSLSPYDVGNVQLLLRRLLLESTGFWKY